jgi:Protein of unknown function (DUF1353)
MPDPKSIIPSSQPADLATVLQKPTLVPQTAAFQPGAPEAVFLHHFPLPYKVQAVTIYEAKRHGWPTDRSYWQFLDPFRYVSDKWGPINIPAGFYTDFASVPPSIHSIFADYSLSVRAA